MASNLVFNKSHEILIVEDEAILALSLEEKLSNMGLNVCAIASNYEQAINFIDSKIPDLAIIDINLNSRKSGIDVANYIWENHQIPILFLTVQN